jgi:hypothetical protein
MNAPKTRSDHFVTFAMVALSAFYLIYWPGKILRAEAGILFDYFIQIKQHWGTLAFLAFLGVASLFVDLVVRWDAFGLNEKRIRATITALLCIAFVLHILTGILDLYIVGEIK